MRDVETHLRSRCDLPVALQQRGEQHRFAGLVQGAPPNNELQVSARAAQCTQHDCEPARFIFYGRGPNIHMFHDQVDNGFLLPHHGRRFIDRVSCTGI